MQIFVNKIVDNMYKGNIMLLGFSCILFEATQNSQRVTALIEWVKLKYISDELLLGIFDISKYAVYILICIFGLLCLFFSGQYRYITDPIARVQQELLESHIKSVFNLIISFISICLAINVICYYDLPRPDFYYRFLKEFVTDGVPYWKFIGFWIAPLKIYQYLFVKLANKIDRC